MEGKTIWTDVGVLKVGWDAGRGKASGFQEWRPAKGDGVLGNGPY